MNPMIKARNSTQVESHTYDPETSTLYVRFTRGGLYSYYGVPKEVYQGMNDMEATGKYFAANIKGKYTYKKEEEK
ncbi:MAG: KTSC domain-containing protein [Candidatus Subteraquimicrobiales bacterium]|nr:KTSC domain-containing protein [Candidatus Subteraquimicrobiales bacterium]